MFLQRGSHWLDGWVYVGENFVQIFYRYIWWKDFHLLYSFWIIFISLSIVLDTTRLELLDRPQKYIFEKLPIFTLLCCYSEEVNASQLLGAPILFFVIDQRYLLFTFFQLIFLSYNWPLWVLIFFISHMHSITIICNRDSINGSFN